MNGACPAKAESRHRPPKSFAADARRALLANPWPGNAREVKHLIDRVAQRVAEKDIITADMLVLSN